MASTTSENYVTETILVPLYNRSAGLRKLISKKFGTKVNFGDSIQFTGNNRKDDKYGHPDATSDSGNYIEVKIYNDCELQESQKKGCKNGYEKYLNENKDKYLLYIVPDNYSHKADFVKNDRSKYMEWGEILDYIREQNEYDPLIPLICDKVEGIKLDEVRTLISYKVKVYESLIKASGKNPKLSIILNDDEGINVLPDTMGEEDMNVISFKYEGEEERNQYCFWFEKDGIALYLPEEFTKSYNNHRNKFKLKNGILRMEIVSKKDFWTLTTDEIANKIAKQTKEFVKAYDEAELENKK